MLRRVDRGHCNKTVAGEHHGKERLCHQPKHLSFFRDTHRTLDRYLIPRPANYLIPRPANYLIPRPANYLIPRPANYKVASRASGSVLQLAILSLFRYTVFEVQHFLTDYSFHGLQSQLTCWSEAVSYD